MATATNDHLKPQSQGDTCAGRSGKVAKDGIIRRYIYCEERGKKPGAPALAHIGTRPVGQPKFFPLCGRLLPFSAADSQWMPTGKRVCPGCSARYIKEFGKAAPGSFRK